MPALKQTLRRLSPELDRIDATATPLKCLIIGQANKKHAARALNHDRPTASHLRHLGTQSVPRRGLACATGESNGSGLNCNASRNASGSHIAHSICRPHGDQRPMSETHHAPGGRLGPCGRNQKDKSMVISYSPNSTTTHAHAHCAQRTWAGFKAPSAKSE